jgi:hypothetical protein
MFIILIPSADPASLVVSLSEQLKGYKCPDEWPLMLKDRDEQKEEENRSVVMKMELLGISYH